MAAGARRGVRSPLLRVRDLRLTRGAVEILRGVDWAVQRGEHWVILGPNGSGKTSLLRTLVGYESPTGGTLELLGRTYGETDWRELRRQVGLVTSALQPSIPPGEPALETVVSGRYAQLDLWQAVTPADRRAASRHLRTLGVAHLAARAWLHLSQGEKQRVLIARALMARPRLLILDEPCAGLDPVARAHFLASVEQLARAPRAPGLVLVTHHVEEITPAFTHALVLGRGQTVAAGPLAAVLTSATLTRAFGAALQVRRRGSRAQRGARDPRATLTPEFHYTLAVPRRAAGAARGNARQR